MLHSCYSILHWFILFQYSVTFFDSVNVVSTAFSFSFPMQSSPSIQTSYSTCFMSNLENYEEEMDPISQFGTRLYWDETYEGRGDFPMEEYSWYYGWDDNIKKIWMETVVPNLNSSQEDPKSSKILIPGIGNDAIILDLFGSGWKFITAFDYTQSAIDRQNDLLLYTPDIRKSLEERDIELYVMDATNLNENEVIGESILLDDFDNEDKVDTKWTNKFEIVFEKGALDAIYLSSSENEERLRAAVTELRRVLQTGGIFVSCSGVVPEELRRSMFPTNEWVWLRDGSEDLQAGCFVWKKI